MLCYPPIILLIDLDCFYAQVETIKEPWLKYKPLAVIQKHLVVTANYHARERGIRKCSSITEAKALCPDLVIKNGENLDDYRKASEAFFDVIHSTLISKSIKAKTGTTLASSTGRTETITIKNKHETCIQRTGLDEAFIDISFLVNQLLVELRSFISQSSPLSLSENSLISHYLDELTIQHLFNTGQFKIPGHTLQQSQTPKMVHSNSLIVKPSSRTQSFFAPFMCVEGTELCLSKWIKAVRQSQEEIFTIEQLVDEWRQIYCYIPSAITTSPSVSYGGPMNIFPEDFFLFNYFNDKWNPQLLELRLAIGSHICQLLRVTIAKRLHLTTSAGIAWSKVSSKLTASCKKPNCQTVLLPQVASSFITSHEIKSIQGLGTAARDRLTQIGINTIQSLICKPIEVMEAEFGIEQSKSIVNACRGMDFVTDPVIASKGPRSISLEDSFWNIGGLSPSPQLFDVLARLIARLVQRQITHGLRYHEIPHTLRIAIRYLKASGRESRQASLPPSIISSMNSLVSSPAGTNNDELMASVINGLLTTATDLLKKLDIHEPLHLLNVSLSNFEGQDKSTTHSILKYFTKEDREAITVDLSPRVVSQCMRISQNGSDIDQGSRTIGILDDVKFDLTSDEQQNSNILLSEDQSISSSIDEAAYQIENPASSSKTTPSNFKSNKTRVEAMWHKRPKKNIRLRRKLSYVRVQAISSLHISDSFVNIT